jgi:hypothetical protein
LLRRNTVGFFVFSWTGFYIGANIGGAWANNWTDTLFLTNFNNNNGVNTRHGA